jgi:hypothetical protein
LWITLANTHGDCNRNCYCYRNGYCIGDAHCYRNGYCCAEVYADA